MGFGDTQDHEAGQTFISTNQLSNSTATASDNMVPSMSAMLTYVNGKMRKTYINGGLRSGLLDWTDSVVTANGVATFYITDDRTATGNPMATNLYADSIQVNYIDNTGVYSTGTPVISPDFTKIVIPIGKQVFTGVTVAGINVLGSVTMNTIPNGVKVKMQVIGDAA